jgi:hypothetical protein
MKPTKRVRWLTLLLTLPLLVLGLASGGVSATTASGSTAPSLPNLQGTTSPARHIALPPSMKEPYPGGIPVYRTSNWSGYVAYPQPHSGTSFTSVSAQYEVPSVNCSVIPREQDGFAYHWVGLDGWSNSSVEQVGVADFCIKGKPLYQAWYEMYPGPITIVLKLNAGDSIYASVSAGPSDKWTLHVLDETTGQSFTTRQPCYYSGACKDSSAEVITETYNDGPPWVGSPNFGHVLFGPAQITDSDGVRGGFKNSSWQVGKCVNDVQSTPVELISNLPSILYSAPSGSAFFVTFETAIVADENH